MPITLVGDMMAQARVASDFSLASSTAFVDIPGLTVGVEAQRTYAVLATVFMTAGTRNGGYAFAVGGTCTASDFACDAWALDGTINKYGFSSTFGASIMTESLGGPPLSIYLRGAVSVASAGELRLRFAQQISNVIPSVIRRNSTFMVQDIT